LIEDLKMVGKFLIVGAMLICMPQQNLAQAQPVSSKELNNQGCDALVARDYLKAEQLFLSAYKSALREQRTRGMVTALNNLATCYRAEGYDDKALKVENLAKSLERPESSPKKSTSAKNGLGATDFNDGSKLGTTSLRGKVRRISAFYGPASEAEKNETKAVMRRGNFNGGAYESRGSATGFESNCETLGDTYHVNKDALKRLMMSGDISLIEVNGVGLFSVSSSVSELEWRADTEIVIGKHPTLRPPYFSMFKTNNGPDDAEREGITAKLIGI
jgi:hypothetical protein